MFTNANGLAFHNDTMAVGDYYKKNVKYWVGFCHGFGIDAELFDEVVVPSHVGVTFIVKNDLTDYRTGKTVCSKGKYRITVERMKAFGQYATLNPKHGRQFFIAAHLCEEV